LFVAELTNRRNRLGLAAIPFRPHR
jgi:hypothetical protein